MKATRILGSALALMLAVGLWTTPAQAVEWAAEPAAWAKAQMEDLADAGVLGHGYYDPTATVNRGQFCYFMVNVVQRMGRWDLLRDTAPMPLDYFADVTSDDGFGGSFNVYTAAAYGLTEGALADGQRLADCNSNLTREQAAKMMCALLDALGRYAGMEQEAGGTPRTFVDADAVSSWAAAYVDRASALNILQGDEAGRFNPQGILTFQETCVMLDRALQAAEQAAAAQGETMGIRTLCTGLEEDADYTLTDRATQMYALKDGSVLVLHGKSSQAPGIWVETFDGSGRSAGVKEIPIELAYCAGFYESDTGYYLAFGQNNMEEDDSREVYRIVRYDKDWNRLGAASVTGGESYTTEPFRSTTHTGMAEEDGTLVLHTARLRYLTPKDGLRHQSNITIKVRTSDMKVLSVSPAFPGNHVSHSFAQYVAFDGGKPVYADHGDAYPRGFALNLDADTGYGQEMNFFSFSGPTGQNATYAVPGGLGIGTDNYLFAGASSNQDGNDKLTYCNVFLAVIPKDGFPKSTPEIKWLTSYPKDEQEYVNAVWLVPMNNNTFVVLWQSCRKDDQTVMGGAGDLRCAVFDGAGSQIGQTRTVKGFVAPLNDPTVVDNKIVWVRPEFGPYNVFANSSTRHLKTYELEIDLNPTAQETSASFSFSVEPSQLTAGESGRIVAAASVEGGQFTYISSNYQVARIQGSDQVLAQSPGTATITGTMTWRGNLYTDTCTVTVVPKQTVTPPAGTTTQPGESTAQPGGDGAAQPGGSTTQPSGSGVTSTQLPQDGRVDDYRQEWGDGNWMELEVLDGSTIRYSGCITQLASNYNYVVLRVLGRQAEVQVSEGVPFSLEVDVDVDRLNELYGGDVSRATSAVIAMVCQNHQPGDTSLAGFSFRTNPNISLALDGQGGCTLQVVDR